MISNLDRAAVSRTPAALLRKLLPAGWALAAAAVLVWGFGGWGYDDAYITYRYAENLARGAGFVYNAGERVLSTTTPLYALLLALARLAGTDIPLASNLVACASLALGGLALWRLGQLWQTPLAGAVGLLLYPFFPLLISTIGGEAALYLALALFGFVAYARERYVHAAVLLALAALTRADGVLAALVCGAHFFLARRGRIPWRAVALYAGLLAAWFVFAAAYFGAPFPVTLAAKRRQGLLPASELFLPGLLHLARDQYWRFAIYRPPFVAAAIGLVYALARWRASADRRGGWLLIVGWGVLYVAAYAALGVTSYPWYYAPVVPGFVALIGLGAEALAAGVRRLAGRQWALAVAGALALALLYPQTESFRYFLSHPDTRLAIYRLAGAWLRDHTPPEASVGALEVGIIGYYTERRMVDFAGLIQPDVALRLTPSSSYDEAAVWAASQYRPDYLVLRPGMLPRLEGWAAAVGCRNVQSFSDAAYGELVVLQC
jgi:hypothetical protein